MSRGSLSAVLTAGMNPEEKENFERAFRGSTTVRDRLTALLERLYRDLQEEEENPAFFKEPNISERLALNRGQRRAYRRILEMLAI